MNKTVLLGVSGGIAAYKALEIVKLLKKKSVDVFIIPTKSALQMVSIEEFKRVSDNPVFYNLFEKNFDYKDVLKNRTVDHIQLAHKANLFVIAPATANIIGKIAHGIADDYLTTTLLASTCEVLVCPSMNVHMWQNPAVSENIRLLEQRGYHIIGPDPGPLACGYEGEGRLREAKKIVEEILIHLSKTDVLKGQKVIITAGGTVEKIDEVRIITNRSSGKMGAALAEACYLYGADVLLLRAKNAVKPRFLIKEKVFVTAANLSELIEKYVKDATLLFHAAAVSDFKVATYKGKISSDKSVLLELKPQEKIVNKIKKINPKISLIAFKAEYKLSEKSLIQKSMKKLKESHADCVVANDIGQKDGGFESDSNEVHVIMQNGKTYKIPHNSKSVVAKRILDILLQSNAFS